MIRRPPRSTQSRSSAASDVYKRQVLATDEHGRITFLNPVAEALTGWSGLEVRKKAVADVLRLIDVRTRQAVDNPLMRALRERAMVTAGEYIVLIARSARIRGLSTAC